MCAFYIHRGLPWGDLADAEDNIDEEDWSQGDDEDGFIDSQLRHSDLDDGNLEGSDDKDLYADPKWDKI